MPISSAVNPSWSDPSAETAARSVFVTIADVSSSILSYLHTAQTGVSSDAPGYDHIRFTTRAHWVTGHSVQSPVVRCVTVSYLRLFFCISNVTDTLSADSRAEEGVITSRPFLKKRMFRRQRSLVRLCSFWGTFRYSQNLHAKKKAPIVNCAIARSISVTCRFAISARTKMGRAFCCFCFGSSFRKARNCLDKRTLSSLSLSLVGFFLPVVRKA